MDNREYVRTLGVDVEAQQKCLNAMEKYGDNHWWEPGVDQNTLAYYQLHEDIMLCPTFDVFHEAVEKLLGHPVMTHEFGLAIDRLRREAKRAWTNIGKS